MAQAFRKGNNRMMGVALVAVEKLNENEGEVVVGRDNQIVIDQPR